METFSPALKSVLGLDVGLTLVNPTSGVCRSGHIGDLVSHTYIDYESRAALVGSGPFAVAALDAPVLPPGTLHYRGRPCEKVFVLGTFQKRCKPGESHIRGTGQALRRSGVDTARAFAPHVAGHPVGAPFPRIYGSANIIEAFPNGFLGVSLAPDTFVTTPARNEKFDWLYDNWLEQGVLTSLQAELPWPRASLWTELKSNGHHDERAALICAITAVSVLLGNYVAVGEPVGGYIFMPPWRLWQQWARSALLSNARDSRVAPAVEIWIAGQRFTPFEDLPV